MNKKTIYIIVGIVVLIVLAFIFKPNIPKWFLKDLIEDYEAEDKAKQKKLDSIQKVRERDSISYMEALNAKDFELQEIQSRLDRANYKIRQNEKELNSYRNGDFNERFGKFTRLITVTDSL